MPDGKEQLEGIQKRLDEEGYQELLNQLPNIE